MKIKTSVLIVLGVLLFNSCLTDRNKTKGNKKQAHYTYKSKDDDSDAISNVFNRIDSILKVDNGKFWNHQIYGPLLIVDPETRTFIANENNEAASFKQIRNVYEGILPKDVIIANTALNWDNKRWTMVMSPLPNNDYVATNLIIHELFHGIQPKIGFSNLMELNNNHLNLYRGRLLLTLELEALKKALSANTKENQRQNIINALSFRNLRHSNKAILNAENSQEINEGIAEYTGLMLSGRNDIEIRKHLTNSINQFYNNPTFVRSFAYYTVPVYGYFLSKKNEKWHQNIDIQTNLTDIFSTSFGKEEFNIEDLESISKKYDYPYSTIVKKEELRETKRLEEETVIKNKFLNNSSLKLNFVNMRYSFDPSTVLPIGDLGSYYPALEITDTWGVLKVENGAFMDTNTWAYVMVTKPLELNDKIVKGDGWTLELNQGWYVKNVTGKFQLLKKE